MQTASMYAADHEVLRRMNLLAPLVNAECSKSDRDLPLYRRWAEMFQLIN